MKTYIALLITIHLNADIITGYQYNMVPGNIYNNINLIGDFNSTRKVDEYCYRQDSVLKLWKCVYSNECRVRNINGNTYECYNSKKDIH